MGLESCKKTDFGSSGNSSQIYGSSVRQLYDLGVSRGQCVKKVVTGALVSWVMLQVS